MEAIGISITRDPGNSAAVMAGASTMIINQVIMQLQIMQGRQNPTSLCVQKYAKKAKDFILQDAAN